MPNGATFSAEAQNKFVIAAVEKFIVLVRTQPIVNRLLDEQGLVNHITKPITKHVIIIKGFFSAIDFDAAPVHVNDVSKKSVPISMIGKSLSDSVQSPRPETIIGI